MASLLCRRGRVGEKPVPEGFRSARAAGVARCLEDWWPPLLDELRSLARELVVPEEPVLASWAPPEIFPGGGNSCTVFWVPPQLTAAGRPLVGRNFDLRVDRPLRLLAYTQPSCGFSHVGCAGWCGRSEGINSQGLAAGTAEAQLRSGLRDTAWRLPGRPGGADGVSLPARLVTRIILERCASVDDAVETLKAPQWTRFNYLLADATGKAAVVEVGVGAGEGAKAVRWPSSPALTAADVARSAGGAAPSALQPWLIATNHFVSEQLCGQADYRWLTRQKYARAASELAEALARGPIGPADCQRILAAPGVAQRRLTLWSTVFEPGGSDLWFAPGRPDRNTFRRMPAAGRPPGPAELPVLE